MVDVGSKPVSRRRAVAQATVSMAPATAAKLRSLPKGDALTTAQLAGIMAAKRTADLIPLCHPLPLSVVDVGARGRRIRVAIEAAAERPRRRASRWRPLSAAVVAALTVYDMAKAIDKGMVWATSAPREDEGTLYGRRPHRLGRRPPRTRDDRSGDLLGSCSATDGYEVMRRSFPTSATDRRRDPGARARGSSCRHDRRDRGCPAGVTHEATGRVIDRAAAGIAERSALPHLEVPSRPSVPRRRRRSRVTLDREPSWFAGRLPDGFAVLQPALRARPRAARGEPPRTPRRDWRLPFLSPALRLPCQVRAHRLRAPFAYVGAFLAVDGVPTRTTSSGSRSPWSAPARSRWGSTVYRRRRRRAQPAHGRAASSRRARSSRGTSSPSASARSPSSLLRSTSSIRWALARRSRRGLRGLPVPKRATWL